MRALSAFKYSGPTSGLTLRLEDGTLQEQLLHDGQTVDLPAEHPHVQALVAQHFLEPSSQATRATTRPALADESPAASRRGTRGASPDMATPTPDTPERS